MRTTRFLETPLLHWFCRTSGTAGTSWRRTCRIHWSREDFGRIRKTRVLARHESRKLHPFRACKDPNIYIYISLLNIVRHQLKTQAESLSSSIREIAEKIGTTLPRKWRQKPFYTPLYICISFAEFYRYQSDFAKKYRIENINVLAEGKKQLCSGPVAVCYLCSGSPQKRNWFEAWFGSKLSVQQSICVLMPNSFESCFCFGGFWWHKIAEETSKLRSRNWSLRSPDSLTAHNVVFGIG